MRANAFYISIFRLWDYLFQSRSFFAYSLLIVGFIVC